jgi:acyl carrier protein
MSIDTILQELVRAVLELPADADVTSTAQGVSPTWDSLAHVTLMTALESEFDLEIDLDDSLMLTSYDSVRKYVAARRA